MKSPFAKQIQMSKRFSLSRQNDTLRKDYRPKFRMCRVMKYNPEKNEIIEKIWISIVTLVRS